MYGVAIDRKRIQVEESKPLRSVVNSGLLALLLTSASCASSSGPPNLPVPAAIYPPMQVSPEDAAALTDSQRRTLMYPQFYTPAEQMQAHRALDAARARAQQAPPWTHDLEMAAMGAVTFEAGKNILGRASTSGAAATTGEATAGRLLGAPEAAAPVAIAEGAEAVEVGEAAGAVAEGVELGEVLEGLCLIVCW